MPGVQRGGARSSSELEGGIDDKTILHPLFDVESWDMECAVFEQIASEQMILVASVHFRCKCPFCLGPKVVFTPKYVLPGKQCEQHLEKTVLNCWRNRNRRV